MSSEPTRVSLSIPVHPPQEPVVTGGGLGSSRTGPARTSPPNPALPVATVSSGSAQAADGSTISWTSAPDGTVTATGSAGRRMVIRPVRNGQATLGVSLAFSAPGQGTYLTITDSIVAGRGVSVKIASEGSRLTFTITSLRSTTRMATVPGNIGSTPVHWRGHVDLSAKLPLVPADVPGLGSNAFSSQFAEASYFTPAFQGMAGIATSRTAVVPLEQAPSQQQSPGFNWGKIILQGAAAAGAAAKGAPGPAKAEAAAWGWIFGTLTEIGSEIIDNPSLLQGFIPSGPSPFSGPPNQGDSSSGGPGSGGDSTGSGESGDTGTSGGGDTGTGGGDTGTSGSGDSSSGGGDSGTSAEIGRASCRERVCYVV